MPELAKCFANPAQRWPASRISSRAWARRLNRAESYGSVFPAMLWYSFTSGGERSMGRKAQLCENVR